MRQQSRTYNPFTSTRVLDCVVSFGLINSRAKETASAQADATVRTSADNVIDGRYSTLPNYATFEKNGWILGEGNKILPTDSSGLDLGWWSPVAADERGVFADVPYISFSFAEPVTTYGWSLYFDAKNNIFPTKVRFTAYAADGETVVATRLFENKKAELYASFIVENYSSVKVEFISMNKPFRKVRLLEMDFGLTQKFDKDTLVKVNILEDADVICRNLPSRQITFTFDNSTKIYNLLKPDMLYDYFSSGSAISALIRVNGEDVDMGSFFFSSAEAKSDALVAKITANDLIMQLDKVSFTNAENKSMKLSAAVDIMLEGYDIERVYSDGVGDTLVNLSTASSIPRREMLRQLAQAAMCTCFINRDGKLMFKNLITAEDYDSTIDKHALYDYSGITVADNVTKVVLTANNPLVYGGVRTWEAGEGTRKVEVNNPCVHDDNGQAVAEWLLAGYRRRISYKVKNRCDPAVEIGDTVKLDDTFGANLNAAVTGIDIVWDGKMYARTEAVI